ncbi:Envelope glycoprotein [Cricetulus griseus]|uniref:Envelope glycoprotein n=1 Tax=Cricetulus griseus TaxID=10029 RepID=G3H9K7_CRIGR|nr:Envelope glycoprotein [Cricetulus griseus]
MDAGLAEGLSSWISTAMNHLKEWAGIGALTGFMVLASRACLWCICRMRVSQRRNVAMIIQAFTAVGAGQFPQAWSAIFEHRIRGLRTALEVNIHQLQEEQV